MNGIDLARDLAIIVLAVVIIPVLLIEFFLFMSVYNKIKRLVNVGAMLREKVQNKMGGDDMKAMLGYAAVVGAAGLMGYLSRRKRKS